MNEKKKPAKPTQCNLFGNAVNFWLHDIFVCFANIIAFWKTKKQKSVILT